MENPQKAFNNGDGIKLKDFLQSELAHQNEAIDHLREIVEIQQKGNLTLTMVGG